jgi:cell fate regulator YaaT (PSP1 superfamily)
VTCAGVRFRTAGRVYYFAADGYEDLAPGDRVIVDTQRGPDLGWVAVAPGQVLASALQGLRPISRRASWADLNSLARLRTQEADTLRLVREKAAAYALPLKAVLAEYAFDGSRLTVYFVSEERRVDFRELVKDLGRSLKTRVLLHQVGPRDQAKLVGGIDRCGRELCCSSWMTEFEPISIKMAKSQRLPLNPAEISGVCGKLLCCLAFEDEQYREMQAGLPKVGARLTSAVGAGRVVEVNVLARTITVQWDTGNRVVVGADELAEQQERRARLAEPPSDPSPEG